MATVGVREISQRLGIHYGTAWRWSRRMRFGEPVNPGAPRWQFEDDEMLALTLSILKKRGPSKQTVWETNKRGFHVQRLNAICRGEVDADDEDRQMAATLLSVAARQHQRRAQGLANTATVSAWLACGVALSRSRAGDPNIPKMFYQFASQLSPEKDNSTTPPE